MWNWFRRWREWRRQRYLDWLFTQYMPRLYALRQIEDKKLTDTLGRLLQKDR